MSVLTRTYVKYATCALRRSTKSALFKEFLSAFCEWWLKANLHRLKFVDKALLHFCIQHDILTVVASTLADKCGA